MRLVVDASVTVAALADRGATGEWAEEMFVDHELIAPHSMIAETANILRRSALAGLVTDDFANLAYLRLRALRVDLLAYTNYAERIWQLRNNLTVYDAWYVAIAESLNSPLATSIGDSPVPPDRAAPS